MAVLSTCGFVVSACGSKKSDTAISSTGKAAAKAEPKPKADDDLVRWADRLLEAAEEAVA